MPLAKFPNGRKWYFVLIFCLIALLSLGAWAQADAWHRVRVVIDGDTLILDDGTKVRLGGINTPELGRDGTQDQPMAQAAKVYLQQILADQKVRLETDLEQRDRYDRLIAYVSTEKGSFINQQLLDAGFATLSLHPPNLKYADLFARAQSVAMQKRRGLWGHVFYRAQRFTSISSWPRRQWGRFEAQVQRIESTRQGTRLWCSSGHYVWIPARYAAWFPDGRDYLGRWLEIHGWPARRGGNWFVSVRHPSQLILKPALTVGTPEPEPDQMAPAH